MTLVYALVSSTSGLTNVLSGIENFTTNRDLAILPDVVRPTGVVYNEIVDNLLASNDLMLEAVAPNILVSDKIFLFLDPEIAHGATLEIEYAITVTALNGLQGYKIKEDLNNNNLKFSENGKLITENKTNKEVGWRYENGVPVKNGSGGSTERNKIVLSTVISAEDFSYTYKNIATCTIRSIGVGESTATTFSRTVESPELSIIPPFGNGNADKLELGKYIPIIITLIGTLAIIVIITKKKK